MTANASRANSRALGSSLTSRTNGPLEGVDPAEPLSGCGAGPVDVPRPPGDTGPPVVDSADCPGVVRLPAAALRAVPGARLAVDRTAEPAPGVAPWTRCDGVPAPDEVAAAAVAGCDAAPLGSAAREGDAARDGEPEFEPPGDPPPSGFLTVVTGGSDGVLTGGVVMPGVLTGGVLTGGVVTCGVVSVIVATDGTVTGGTVTAGTEAEGTLTDGRLTDGTTIVGRPLPSATAVDAPSAATRAAHATRTPLTVQLSTPAPRTAFPPITPSTCTTTDHRSCCPSVNPHNELTARAKKLRRFRRAGRRGEVPG